ncbi:type II toxin-antitoxin system RelE/ParE family toxin [Kluyvera sichuanensis]|uniref:type II toxin-antitoxin system RelE/ParE family toxin n=2 Tax=Kluyvera sichuanensis TaxID=2725494 RepID=UPI0039F67177
MYKLSNSAVEDFESIYEFTWYKFGAHQADKYTRELDTLFSLLAKNPAMGHDCSALKEGIRQHNHRQHAIYYQLKEDGIFIIRILHQQMQPALHLQ